MASKTFNGGVHPDDSKAFSRNAGIEQMPLPTRVVIPLSQHIGSPANPVVKVGELVKTGQLIAEASGFISVGMHSSVSGKVKSIDRFTHPTGSVLMGIEIESDGKDEWIELCDEEDYYSLSVEEMKKRIADAGVCGMGGAGFPTLVKLSPPKDVVIDTVIVNGVECEPYLTADYRLMMERPEDLINGLKIVMKILNAKTGVIGIEENKPEAIKILREYSKDIPNIRVDSLKLKYPQGAEKQLIYATTGRKVPNKGGLPSAVGVAVDNVGTAIAVYEAVRYKRPVVERVITVTGSIVKKPSNLNARIGTSFSELLAHCQGTSEQIAKVISGGPMMGFAINTLEVPVTKTTSGIILLNEKEAKADKEHTCLRCARCVDVCPLNLMPSYIASSVRYEDLEMVERAGAMDCMKCGCCAFVCPAHIKLIQWIDIGKNKITAKRRAEQAQKLSKS